MAIRAALESRRVAEARSLTPAPCPRTISANASSYRSISIEPVFGKTDAVFGMLNGRLQESQKNQFTRLFGVVGGRGLVFVESQCGQAGHCAIAALYHAEASA